MTRPRATVACETSVAPDQMVVALSSRRRTSFVQLRYLAWLTYESRAGSVLAAPAHMADFDRARVAARV